jgi:hypothetical protein|tara:strand:- start:17 stop:316 length:300 start_codon:yes stop_codon:yes gene_type:complete
MKSTPLKTHITDDEDKNLIPGAENQRFVGATIVETISRSPLMQRVGIILKICPEFRGIKRDENWADICWQPSAAMPLGQPYRSLYILSELNDHYIIEQE